MLFSSGDYIAIAIGSIAAIRWIIEKYFTRSENDESKLQRLELAFETYKAGAFEREKAFTESILRIERGIASLQSQLRLIVSDGANNAIEIRSMK